MTKIFNRLYQNMFNASKYSHDFSSLHMYENTHICKLLKGITPPKYKKKYLKPKSLGIMTTKYFLVHEKNVHLLVIVSLKYFKQRDSG